MERLQHDRTYGSGQQSSLDKCHALRLVHPMKLATQVFALKGYYPYLNTNPEEPRSGNRGVLAEVRTSYTMD